MLTVRSRFYSLGYCHQFSYLYLPAAGNGIVYKPRSGTNRERQYHFKERLCRLLREITFHPSISFFPLSLLSIFRQKVRKRSVGNRHQKSYSRADLHQRIITTKYGKNQVIAPYYPFMVFI